MKASSVTFLSEISATKQSKNVRVPSPKLHPKGCWKFQWRLNRSSKGKLHLVWSMNQLILKVTLNLFLCVLSPVQKNTAFDLGCLISHPNVFLGAKPRENVLLKVASWAILQSVAKPFALNPRKFQQHSDAWIVLTSEMTKLFTFPMTALAFLYWWWGRGWRYFDQERQNE